MMDITHPKIIRYWRKYIPRHILKTIIYNSFLFIDHLVLVSHSCKHKEKKVC